MGRKKLLSDACLSIDELKRLQEDIYRHAKELDPLASWYDFVSFISVDEMQRLAGGLGRARRH